MSEEIIILICSFAGDACTVNNFLSTNQQLAKYRKNEQIWKDCYESYIRYSKLSDFCKLNSGRNPRVSPFTYKGMVWKTYENLKSFCWKESPGSKPTSSPDRISGVNNYGRIMIPSCELHGQCKLIYCLETDSYFLVISTSSRLEIHQISPEKLSCEQIYQETGINFKQCRRSFTKDECLIILRDNQIVRINLLELGAMTDEDTHQVLLTLPQENEFSNFVIMDQSKILLTSPTSILLYDVVEEHMINKIDIDLSKLPPNFPLKRENYTNVWFPFPREGVCELDLRTATVSCVVENPVSSFTVDGDELIILKNDHITYYDSICSSTVYCKFFDREAYSYLKADKHRVALMSGGSLIFKNHGEVNDTVGKEVVNYSQRGTNTVNYDRFCTKFGEDPFIKLIDFDYFDMFYCVFTQSKVKDPECPSYVELFQNK